MSNLPQTKHELMQQLAEAQSALEQVVNQFTDEQMTDVRDHAGWSIKDHLDHLAIWEESVAALLERCPRAERFAAMGVDIAAVQNSSEDEVNGGTFLNWRLYIEQKEIQMTNRIAFSIVGAILLLMATTAFALAWPDKAPEKVLISGPGIEGQVEVKDEQALAIFRLGNLEDFGAVVVAPPQGRTGYKVMRFFGDELDFARLTYYPDPSGGRGAVYFEDGPMLQGNHTPYNQTWHYTKPDAEKKLRALLKQLGAKFDDAAPAEISASGRATQAGQAFGAQTANASEPNAFSSAVIALLAGAVGALGAAVAFWLWRVRRTQVER